MKGGMTFIPRRNAHEPMPAAQRDAHAQLHSLLSSSRACSMSSTRCKAEFAGEIDALHSVGTVYCGLSSS
jgi:hypothetical protein